MPPGGARMQHLDRADRSPYYVPFEPAADDLNLW